MYCKKCGSMLESTDSVCKNCGESVQVTPITNDVNPQPVNQNVGVAGTESINMVNPQPVNQNVGVAGPEPVNMVNPGPVNPNMGVAGPEPVNMVNPQPVYPTSTEPTNNKNNKVLFIVIVAVLAVLIVVLLVVLLNKKSSSNSSNNNITTTAVTDTTNNTNTDNNPSTVSNSNVAVFNGFEFTVPTGYNFSDYVDYFEMVNETDQIAFRGVIYFNIRLSDLTGETLENLKTKTTAAGYTIKSIDSVQYGGIDWLVLNLNDGQYDYFFGYTDFGSSYLFECFQVNLGTKSNDVVLAEISKMVSTATYKGTTNFSNADSNDTKPEIGITGTAFDASIFN